MERETAKKYNYLKINIGFIGDGKIDITKPQHINEVLEDFR